MQFIIQSSDTLLLDKATQVAKEFANQYIGDDIVGIVFLGAIVRGYYDHSADIDIALFKKQASQISLDSQYIKLEGFEVHCHLADYESEIAASWDMAKRWAFSERQIYYDPQGKIAQLLEEKVPLKPGEKKWLLMSGLTLSEWYISRLTQLWVERGSVMSAHHMFNEGMSHFYNMLFALNDRLVADHKWRYYCVERLERLPPNFQERVRDIMLLGSFSEKELERRKAAFMEMWQIMVPIVEKELHMTYEEISQLV